MVCYISGGLRRCGVQGSVLARPIPKGTVPFGASNVPFGSAPKPAMCPLGQPQNRQFSFCIQQPLKLLELMKTERPLKCEKLIVYI